jgi:hypothetical protein
MHGLRCRSSIIFSSSSTLRCTLRSAWLLPSERRPCLAGIGEHGSTPVDRKFVAEDMLPINVKNSSGIAVASGINFCIDRKPRDTLYLHAVSGTVAQFILRRRVE